MIRCFGYTTKINDAHKWRFLYWWKLLLVNPLFFFPIFLLAQNKDSKKNEIIETRIEYLIEDAEESDADYTTIFDQLTYFIEHPLNLNKANIDDLEALGILGSFQINNLLVHQEKNGKLMTLEELQTIEGFDLATIKRLLPFVKVTSNVDDAQLKLKTLLKKMIIIL